MVPARCAQGSAGVTSPGWFGPWCGLFDAWVDATHVDQRVGSLDGFGPRYSGEPE